MISCKRVTVQGLGHVPACQTAYTATGSSTYNGSGDFVVISDGPFADFTALQCDGVTLTQGTHYTVVSGSTVATVKESYMQTLSNGAHTFTFIFSDGTAAHTVTVSKSGSSTSPAPSAPQDSTTTPTSGSPQTDDASNMGPWVMLLVASLAALCAGVILWRRRRQAG